MEPIIDEAREKLAFLGKLLFERRLTDAAGGNLSARVGDVLVMSPSYAGHRQQWHLEPCDVLVVDMNRNILAGEGQLTRESHVHFKLHHEFNDAGTAVIHAHPHHLMVFAALAIPMPAVLEANLKFGDVPVVDFAPAHSAKLADNIAAALRGHEAQIQKHAYGAIAPWHGLFLMGKDLDAAFDAVERFDTNAHCIIMSQMMGLGNNGIALKQDSLLQAMKNFEAHS